MHPYFINPPHLSARVGVKMTIKNAEGGRGAQRLVKRHSPPTSTPPPASVIISVLFKLITDHDADVVVGFKIGKASCRGLKISGSVATNTARLFWGRPLFKNIQRCRAYKCCNTDLNRGHWLVKPPRFLTRKHPRYMPLRKSGHERENGKC